MLKYSVQSKLYAILYVDQNLQYKFPMYGVVDKDTINFEIIPYLSTAKRGFNTKITSSGLRLIAVCSYNIPSIFSSNVRVFQCSIRHISI